MGLLILIQEDDLEDWADNLKDTFIQVLYEGVYFLLILSLIYNKLQYFGSTSSLEKYIWTLSAHSLLTADQAANWGPWGPLSCLDSANQKVSVQEWLENKQDRDSWRWELTSNR